MKNPSLDNPDLFTLICCADKKSYELNTKYSKTKSPLVAVNTVEDSTIMKRCLLDLVRNGNCQENWRIIINKINMSSPESWNWDNLIDRTFVKYQLEDEVTEAGIKYASLISILNPKLNLLSAALERERFNQDSKLPDKLPTPVRNKRSRPSKNPLLLRMGTLLFALGIIGGGIILVNFILKYQNCELSLTAPYIRCVTIISQPKH